MGRYVCMKADFQLDFAGTSVLELPSTCIAGGEAAADFRSQARAALGVMEKACDAGAAALALQASWAISGLAHASSVAWTASAADYARPGMALSVVVAAMVCLLLDHAGAYRPARSLLQVRETANLMSACVKTGLVLLAGDVAGWLAMPAIDVLLTLLVLFAFLLVEKTAVHVLEDKLHARGSTSLKTALCGTGLCCRRLFTTLINSPRAGLWPKVVVDPSAKGRVVESNHGQLRSAEIVMKQFDCKAIRDAGVKRVLFIAGSFPESEQRQMMAEARSWGLEAEICAGDIASASQPAEWAEFDGMMLWRQAVGARPVYGMAKRAFDMACAATLLVLFAPLMAIIAAGIKLTSPGSVLFRQQRVGKGGQLFTMLKFRSMHQHACGDAFSPTSGADPRTSRIGRLLRKTSLDELPQLINVLCGDMSLVGPRPEMPFIADGYTPLESRRLEVKPGITGLWQISAHRKDLIHNNMQYDLYYLRNRGWFLDIAILMHTAAFAMRGI